MKPLLTALAMTAAALPAYATDVLMPADEIIVSGADIDLDTFKWTKRPVVVFADSAADPAFQLQMEYINERLDALAERDVIVLTDTDPDAQSDLRRKLRPRGFMMVLIGKDGGVKLRKPRPWDVREITRSIDKMPMRQQEIRDRRAAASE